MFFTVDRRNTGQYLVDKEILVRAGNRDVYFWATHAGAELDLLIFKGGQTLGFEVKYMDAPSTTRSMRIALEDLELDHLYVIYPGTFSYTLDKEITVLPVGEVGNIF